MVQENPAFNDLPKSYLYDEINQAVNRVRIEQPESQILDLGVGDTALPLVPAALTALCEASFDMSRHIVGYGPSKGYPFLRTAIKESEYANMSFDEESIFISDGICRDVFDVCQLLAPHQKILIPSPAYPVYNSAQVIQGRGDDVITLPCTEDGDFRILPPEDVHADVVFLCSPMNPTGICMTFEELKLWVDWAIEHKALIIFDGAYADFIVSEEIPRSIYEIPNAEHVAIELRSFSKGAGFTGLRLGYTVIPKIVRVQDVQLCDLWERRQAIQSNGVAYPIQKAGLSVLRGDGKLQARMQVASYLNTAHTMRNTLEKNGHTLFGGKNSPYIWLKATDGDQALFSELLENYHVVSIPGSGYGESGANYVRLSAFLNEAQSKLAIQKIKDFSEKTVISV